MPKLNNIPRLAWLAIGVTVAVLLVPSGVASAVAALKFTGLQGTSGNRADVNPAGQLQVAEANPSDYVNSTSRRVTSAGASVVESPSTAGSFALTVTEIHIGVTLDPNPGSSGIIDLYVSPVSTCASLTGEYFQQVVPAGIGQTEIPMPSGNGIPQKDFLCASVSTGMAASISVTGYLIPASANPGS
jgi:hypothetical protein